MKVSVIMGAFNAASTLSASIDSVLQQTCKDWELIICDDCSTDNTFDVAKSYAEKYPNIRVIRNEKNSRLAYSLNHCLKYVQGEYIARMDTDDLCLPDRLEKQVAFLDAHPDLAVVGGGVMLFDGEKVKKTIFNPEKPRKEYLAKGVPFFHPTIMMRKSVYDALNGYIVSDRTKRGQDYDMWFRFYAKGFRGYNLQEPVLRYHDSLSDYSKKSSWNMTWGATKTMWLGFNACKMPLFLYPWILKPIVSWLLPKKLIYMIHNKKT
ncbi:glycosyltransferase family 2 protein [uncultured Bacteroides sp.]|uniref:glycosyltransferase family 2 protein n=1 Tax=uncultured Bacteroides sp. TaxID=162156 RepID=UPI00280C1FCE|nr:glycosyltransferase family 2 protein [uncultured Bacteroides sp.]